MSKKDRIMGILALLFFVGAGYVLYAGLFKKPDVIVVGSAPGTSTGPKNINTLLPEGTNFDLKPIKDRNQELGITSGSLYPYPVLNPAEVGVAPDAMIAPSTPPSTQSKK